MIDELHGVLRRYPRLCAHLICESLGYFTPRSAANAILAHKRREPFWCEWYCHIAQYRTGPDRDKLLAVGREVLQDAIAKRRYHRGYMADYQLARQAVAAELAGHGPEFASWF